MPDSPVRRRAEIESFPKPPSRAKEKRSKKQRENAWIAEVRERIAERDNGCRVCEWMVESTGIAHRWSYGCLEMHEIVYRSQTRGQPIEQRVNMHNCILLCREHHQAIHEKRLRVVIVDDECGADGVVRFEGAMV